MSKEERTGKRLDSYVFVRWEDCYQLTPSSMICFLPTAIEGGCTVSVDHALFSNVFSTARIYHFGLCIDEFQSTMIKGGLGTHYNPAFVLNVRLGQDGYFPFESSSAQRAFYYSEQKAYIPSHEAIDKLTITLTNDAFQPLVWDSNNFPTLAEYKFNLLLRIKHA